MSLPEVISIVQSHLRRYYCLFDYIHAILLFAEQSLVKFLWMTKTTQITGVVLPVHAIARFSAIRQKTFAPIKDQVPLNFRVVSLGLFFKYVSHFDFCVYLQYRNIFGLKIPSELMNQPFLDKTAFI